MVHPPPPTYAGCGCATSENRCGSLFFSLDEDIDLTNRTGCPQIDPVSCTNLTNTPSDDWNYDYNTGVEVCAGASTGCSPCQIGKVTQPPPPLSRPTVTVWYNNEVCLIFNIHCCCLCIVIVYALLLFIILFIY